MILYTLYKNSYISIRDLEKKEDGSFDQKIYVNLTNKCPCACTFCLRQTKEMLESNTLWIKKEPSAKEVIEELDSYNLSATKEIVFCGFGEPTERIDTFAEIADHIRKNYPDIQIRMNTNGLGSLVNHKDIAPMLEGRLDTVSISLNTSSAKEYLDVTKSRFGIGSYQAMKDFAVECKKYVPHVVMTVVDVIGQKEIEECKKITEELGVEYSVRPFEK